MTDRVRAESMAMESNDRSNVETEWAVRVARMVSYRPRLDDGATMPAIRASAAAAAADIGAGAVDDAPDVDDDDGEEEEFKVAVM